MIQKLFKNKIGGFKELLYDNLSIVLVLILIMTIAVTSAVKTLELGTAVDTKKDDLINIMK